MCIRDRRHRAEYYERLQGVRDRGDWEGWLIFFLRGVAEVSAEATHTARRILALREEHRSAINTHLGRAVGNGHRVLETLYQRPIIAVSEVQDLIGTTYPAANQLVSRLTELGIIKEITGNRRNRLFRYEPYIRVFTEGDQEPDENQSTGEGGA